jgi:hypothetical protein
VAITGAGFTGATAVDFGVSPATNVTVQSDTTITASSPPGVGTVDVTVISPGGTSAITAADRFTYSSAPVITGVSPSAGPLAGGTSVTITGTGFTNATAVDFGSVAATGVMVTSATTITALSPSGTGTVHVTVITPNGKSAASPADQFTYVAAPVVAGISPAVGPVTGGTFVTITGTNLAGATAVNFGTAAVTSLISNTARQIVVISPLVINPIAVNVTVTTPGGTSATSSADQFLYFSNATTPPSVQGISPNIGLPVGGTMVTIAGTGFVPNSPTVVDFGPTPATGITVVSNTEITAFSPPGTGAVHVTVTTLTGSSSPTAADLFTYSADGPQVTNVQRFGIHAQPTSIVITFNSALDPIPAQNSTNYLIVGPGKHHVKVRSASYNPVTHSVSLALAQRLSLHKTYMLTINGTPPSGLKNPAGLFLDGAGTGQPGSDYVALLTSSSFEGPLGMRRVAMLVMTRTEKRCISMKILRNSPARQSDSATGIESSYTDSRVRS